MGKRGCFITIKSLIFISQKSKRCFQTLHRAKKCSFLTIKIYALNAGSLDTIIQQKPYFLKITKITYFSTFFTFFAFFWFCVFIFLALPYNKIEECSEKKWHLFWSTFSCFFTFSKCVFLGYFKKSVK
jgi:hypothetical protein